MDTVAEVVWAMFFAAIGLGYVTYSRRQRAAMPLVCGISLFIFPYFMPNAYVLVLVGALIAVLPFFIKI
jgi:predicted membrane protein